MGKHAENGKRVSIGNTTGNWLSSHESQRLSDSARQAFYSILLERRQFISAATPTNCRSTLPPSTFLLLLSRPVLHLQFGGIRFGVLRVLILFFFFDFDSCASISIWMVSPGGNTRAWTYGTWANYPIKRQHFVLSHCRHRPQLQLWSPACVGLASNRCPNIDIWCVLFVGMAPWRFWVRFESCSRGVHN